MATKTKETHGGTTNLEKNSIVDFHVVTAKKFDENKTYTFAVPITWVQHGKEITIKTATGKDLNYAVQTVYAEAGGLKKGTAEERKAMADVLTNRIGAANISTEIAKTYTEVVKMPKQFACFS